MCVYGYEFGSEQCEDCIMRKHCADEDNYSQNEEHYRESSREPYEERYDEECD